MSPQARDINVGIQRTAGGAWRVYLESLRENFLFTNMTHLRELRMKNLMVVVLTFLVCQGFSQPLTIQLSTGADSAYSPSMTVGDDGKIWIVYRYGSSLIDGGYYDGNAWNPTILAPLPGDVQENLPVATTVDEMQRFWLVYGSNSGKVEAGFFQDGGQWIHVQTLGSIFGTLYGTRRSNSGGVWLYNTDAATQKIVYGWHAAGAGIISVQDILIDFGWPTGNRTWNYPHDVVSLPSDSLIVAFQHGGESWTGGNNWNVSTLSVARFLQADTVVGIDSAYRRDPRDNGWTTYIGALGSTQSDAFVLVDKVYRSWPIGVLTYVHFYTGFLFSGTNVAHRWGDIIPPLQNPPQIWTSASRGSEQVAIAWIWQDTIRVKVLDGLTWFTSTPVIDTVSDGMRQNLRVHVTPDSLVYLSYDAMKDGRRRVFLTRFRPPYIVDPLLTDIPNSDEPIPREVRLRQNYPNPFNPHTTIEYDVPGSGFVTLNVYNVLGERVAALVNEMQEAGRHRTTFDARGLPSGVYFYQLKAGSVIMTRKALLIR
jgi:hypothetical protein